MSIPRMLRSNSMVNRTTPDDRNTLPPDTNGGNSQVPANCSVNEPRDLYRLQTWGVPDRLLKKNWRRGWDSNPRLSFPNTRFRGELFRPLRHLSAS